MILAGCLYWKGFQLERTSGRSIFELPDVSFGNMKRMDPKTHLGFWGELMGRTHMIFDLLNLPKTQ